MMISAFSFYVAIYKVKTKAYKDEQKYHNIKNIIQTA